MLEWRKHGGRGLRRKYQTERTLAAIATHLVAIAQASSLLLLLVTSARSGTGTPGAVILVLCTSLRLLLPFTKDTMLQLYHPGDAEVSLIR